MAATILPSTLVPIGMSKASPSVALTEGAVKNTTFLVLSPRAAQTSSDYTLTAAYARRVGERTVERAAYMYVKASADRSYRVDVLFAASRYAAHAVDAFIVVAHDVRRGQIYRENEVFAFETVFVYAVTEREFLQLAVMVALA